MKEFLPGLRDFVCLPVDEGEVIDTGWGGSLPGEQNFNWGISHDDEWKINQSIGVKKSWENDDERRMKLSERNKLVKSQEMKDRWKNPTPKQILERERLREMGKSIPKPWTKNKRNRVGRKVYGCGIIYDNAFSAADAIGIHPVNIRRRCRLNTYTDWYYI